jgi:hypothetical protein
MIQVPCMHIWIIKEKKKEKYNTHSKKKSNIYE